MSSDEAPPPPPPPPPPPLSEEEELHQQQLQQQQRHQRAARKRAEKRATVALKAGSGAPALPSNGEVSNIAELQSMLRNFTQTASFDDSIVKSSSTSIAGGASVPHASTRNRSATLSAGDVFASSSSSKEHRGGERKSRKSRSRTGSRQSSRQHSPERNYSPDLFAATAPNLARPLSPFGAGAPPPPAFLPAKPAPPSSKPPGSPQLAADAIRKAASISHVNSADSLVPRLSFRAPAGAAPPRPSRDDDAARLAARSAATTAAAAATPSSLLALSLSPRGVVNANQVIADSLESHSGEPPPLGEVSGEPLRRASSSIEVLSGGIDGAEPVPVVAAAGKQTSKRHCMLCRQRFASAVALNQHIKQQHQCAQCSEIARVAYRVDASGVARRLCSRCAVAELLAAAQPGAPRVLRDMPPSPNHGILPIAPVAPISPRSAYVQAVLQARVRAASRGTSPEREPSPNSNKNEPSSLNSSGGVANPTRRRNTKTQHLRRGSHDLPRTPTTPTTTTTTTIATTPTTPTTPTTATPTTPTTTSDVPPPLPPDQIRADDDNFVAEPPPPLLPNPTMQAAQAREQQQQNAPW